MSAGHRLSGVLIATLLRRRRLVRLEVGVQDLRVGPVAAHGAEVPELVLFDRAANDGIEIEEEQLRHVTEVVRGILQVPEIVRLEFLSATVGNPFREQPIAALFGDHVHSDAAERVLRTMRVGRVHQLLDRRFLCLRHAADAELAGPAPDEVLARLEPVDHRMAVLGIGAVGHRAGVPAGDDHARNERGAPFERS